VTRLLLAVVIVTGCSKRSEPATQEAPVTAMPAAEVQRGQDACKAYVDQVCACAAKVPAVQPQCDLAHALPDAIRIALDVAANRESARDIALQSQASVRKTVKQCIEQTAKLPALGCP
jgi:hypothetical protein